MSDISNLDMVPEELPGGEVDYDAPESGSFPPTIYPGVYDFQFALPESQDDQFGVVEIGDPKVAHLLVNFTARIPTHSIKDDQLTGERPDLDFVDLRFQKVNTYKSPKMQNSFLGELLRSLNLKIQPFTKEGVKAALRENDGRVMGRGSVAWRSYCKSCDLTISTAPRKAKNGKKADVPWPKSNDGKPKLRANCPNCGTGYYGREEINGFKLPVS